jgi:hypothetical protein
MTEVLMATVISTQTLNRPEADRRVRHPLHSLRGYIRTYIMLEGATVAVIFLALWFWIGLALDYGPFLLFAFDWVQELNAALDPDTALLVRTILLGALILGLVAVVAFKIVSRLMRELSDPALALVLERRYPRELGDRLITAVELADNRSADRFGYSQAMIDRTIQDAAERVERLPVHQVFNWARLVRQGLVAAACTLGLYLLTFVGYVGYAVVTEQSSDGFFWRFNNVAAIWTERNVLLMDTYWPRRAYLEVIRFRAAEGHADEMRVARDEQRPDVDVRAIQWVIADRRAENGWRPLRWADLPGLLDESLFKVPLPGDWGGWVIDFDDLDPSVPASAVPALWAGKTAAFIRTELARPAMQQAFSRREREAVQRLLAWRDWTVDKIWLQIGPVEKSDVRAPMRVLHPEAVKGFEDVFAKLEELAETPSMSRCLRKLEVPTEVSFAYRGKTTKGSQDYPRQEGNKYAISLAELKESVSFTVRGEDFYTSPRQITLVPPPGLTDLTMDKEEPAYIYWWLQGDLEFNRTHLRGKRQQLRNVPVSITATSHIPLPLRGSVALHARADRTLKSFGLEEPPDAERKIRGSVLPVPVDVAKVPGQLRGDPKVPIMHFRWDADKRGFHVGLKDVTRPIEFVAVFYDLDGVKGRRHVIVEPVDDRGPQEVASIELVPVLRKYRVQAGPGTKGGPAAPVADGLLITPDALLPFKGTFKDEYGLTDLSWVYHVEQVEFELMHRPSAGKVDKGSGLVLSGSTRLRRAGLVVSGLQAPTVAGQGWLAPLYWSWLDRVVAADVARAPKDETVFEGSAPLEGFQAQLAERANEAIPLAALEAKLTGPAPRPGQMLNLHSLQGEEGFDFKKHLAKLKAADPARDPQLHYRVRLFVTAVDNNIETGPTRTDSKMPVTFLVISENELLAQILLEEEVLRERLEKAVSRLKDAKDFLDEQIGKLSSPGPKLSVVGTRVMKVREFLGDSARDAREVTSDYGRILKEMTVNRVEARRIDKVETKIWKPLGEITSANTGNFAVAENVAAKLSEGLEDDVARIKKAEDTKQAVDEQLLETNRTNHLKLATETRDDTARLIERLEEVLQAIGGELDERETIAFGIQIERNQRRTAEELARAKKDLEDWLVNSLNEGPK